MSESTVVFGDLHSKFSLLEPRIRRIVEREDVSRLVFIGDCVDEWLISDADKLTDLKRFVDFLERPDLDRVEIDVLLGNHELQYLIGSSCSGTSNQIHKQVKELLSLIDFKIAVCDRGWLITHAGVTRSWCDANIGSFSDTQDLCDKLNDLYHSDMTVFNSAGPKRGGFGKPSPLWADIEELKEDMLVGVNQIIGHTPVKRVGELEVVGNRFIFCDTFSLDSMLSPIGNGSIVVITDRGVKFVSTDGDKTYKQEVYERFKDVVNDYKVSLFAGIFEDLR